MSGPSTRQVSVAKYLGAIGERLQADEIICEICIPLVLDGKTRSAFIKLGRRKALAISRLNLAIYLELQDFFVEKARLAIGAAAPVPFRVTAAEQALLSKVGQINAEEIMEVVSRAVADSLGERPSASYKVIAVKGLVWDALSKCGLL